MKTITRFHEFENRLTCVAQGRKYYYLSHEKDLKPIRIKRTVILDYAFRFPTDWEAFVQAEASYLGGTAN